MRAQRLAHLDIDLEPLRTKLGRHPLYERIRADSDLRVFMEHHVFAVWDFMSLLKALQREVTCVDVPWVPRGDAAARRLVNEIVLGEESDEDGRGGFVSHFELYCRAMREMGADTRGIERFVAAVSGGVPVRDALRTARAPSSSAIFVGATWDRIETGSIAGIAAAFTYGREDPIPDMFRRLLAGLGDDARARYPALVYYLERHIEVDGDHHGPAARRLVAILCGDDERRWAEVQHAARAALEARLALWDGVLAALPAPVAA